MVPKFATPNVRQIVPATESVVSKVEATLVVKFVKKKVYDMWNNVLSKCGTP